MLMEYMLGKTHRDQPQYIRLLARLPIGHGILIKKMARNWFESEPTLIKFEMLKFEDVSDVEIKELLKKKE